MLKLPYGLADFPTLIREGYTYLDRTHHLRDLETLGRALLFIRPRRFGKSLWIQTLRTYYDLRTADAHDELFGQLAVGREPTSSAHRYFVLNWNFSEVSPRGTAREIADALDAYIHSTLRIFLSDYAAQLPGVELRAADAKNNFRELLAALRRVSGKLYLLIDEYDNFANEVMVANESAYRELVHANGPFKELMKTVKSAMDGQGLDRLFVTGVSPVVMSDLTSGLNILQDVYLEPRLAGLCGFREDEIRTFLEKLAAEQGDAKWSLEEALDTIRTWYNGYTFSPDCDDKVYNPTLTLYFLGALQRSGAYPRQLLDDNLAADENKLTYLSRIASGRQALLDVVQRDAPVEIPQLATRFRLSDLLSRDAKDPVFFASFLYYFGMLTLGGVTERRTFLLVPPNLVVRRLYIDAIRRFLMPPEAGGAGDAGVLAERHGAELDLRAWAVVSVGFERLVEKSVTGSPRR